MAESPVACRVCGKCCRYEVPITLRDVRRVSEHLGISPAAFFDRYVKGDLSARTSLFVLAKGDDGQCVFQDARGVCTIHAAKPHVCGLFLCSDVGSSQAPTAEAAYLSRVSPERLLAQWAATTATRAYTRRHGTRFCESAFRAALDGVDPTASP